MRKNILVILMLLFSWSISAQKPTHSLGISVEGGPGFLFFGPISGSGKISQPMLGGGGGGAFYYELGYNHLLFRTGLGVDYSALRNRYDGFELSAPINEYNTMQYRYSLHQFKESNTLGMAYVPVLVGYDSKRLYVLGGLKLGYNFGGSALTRTDATIWAVDDDVIDPMQNLYTHQMGDYTFQGPREKIAYSPINAMLSFEIGLNLDKRSWMSAKELKRLDKAQRYRNSRKKKLFKECLHYRLGLFLDYGLNSIHPKSLTPVPNGPEPNGGLLEFPSNAVNSLTPHSALGASAFASQRLNNLLFGVRLSISYEFPQKQPKKGELAYPNIVVFVTDSAGNKLPGTVVQTHSLDNLKRKPVIKTADAKRGRVEKAYPAGNYRLIVSRQGYVPDTIDMQHRDDYDTLRVALRAMPKMIQNSEDVATDSIQPISTFVLHNMYFATAKTDILPTSEQDLQVLYEFLRENPDVRIRIVGHTDDVGSEDSNQKLSEGRSRSVRNEMIKRGIDGKRILTSGKGETQPIVPNDSDEHRQMNRRVEIEVL